MLDFNEKSIPIKKMNFFTCCRYSITTNEATVAYILNTKMVITNNIV